jgi:uncharacterized protein
VTRYQVSFDGTKEEHDSRRVRMDGGGTYERVRGNLLALARLPLEYSIMVRLHVDEKNRHDCFDFVEEFRRDFAGDPRFPLYPRLLSRWGGPGDHTVCPFDEEEGRAVLDEIEDFARSRGVPVRERNGDEPICYAARGNSFVVRSNGRINKCTLALNSTFNDVGAIAEDGTLRLDAARVGAWMRGLWNGSPEELACPMHGLENTSGIRETA